MGLFNRKGEMPYKPSYNDIGKTEAEKIQEEVERRKALLNVFSGSIIGILKKRVGFSELPKNYTNDCVTVSGNSVLFKKPNATDDRYIMSICVKSDVILVRERNGEIYNEFPIENTGEALALANSIVENYLHTEDV